MIRTCPVNIHLAQWRKSPSRFIPRASSHYNQFLLGIGRQGAPGFLTSVLKDEGNCFAEVWQAVFARFALAVGAWYFGTVGDVPWAIPLDDRSKLVVHGYSVELANRSALKVSSNAPPRARARFGIGRGHVWTPLP